MNPDEDAISILYGAIRRRILEIQHDTINRQPDEATVDALLRDIDLIIEARILSMLERLCLIKTLDAD